MLGIWACGTLRAPLSGIFLQRKEGCRKPVLGVWACGRSGRKISWQITVSLVFRHPSSKLSHNWLRHRTGSPNFRASAHRSCQRPPKGLGTDQTPGAAEFTPYRKATLGVWVPQSEHRFPAPSSKRKDVVNRCLEFGY